MLDCFKAQEERVNGPKEQEDKTLRIKDTSGLHLYRVRPSHSFTPPPFQLHPSAPRGQPFENTVNISVFSSSSPQQ